MPYISKFKQIGLTAGAILLIIPALLSFGDEAGRTGSGHIILIYSLILGFQCLVFGFFGLLQTFEKTKLGITAVVTSVIGATFLMTNHTLSLLENIGEISFDVIFEVELMGIGFFALFFPLGLFLIGVTLVKLRQSPLGIALCLATLAMFTGLILLPWLHHLGIIAVSASLMTIAKKI